MPDYIYGIEHLNIDFDNVKNIPVNYLSPNARYILDLYDEDGEVRNPANTYITQDMVDYFKKSPLKYLVYYSSKDITELTKWSDSSEVSLKDDVSIADTILNQSGIIEDENVVSENMEEKMSLFFNKIRDMYALIITENREQSDFIRGALSGSLHVDVIHCGEQIIKQLENKKYILVFIDINISNPSAFEILSVIRSKISRRKLTVIINTEKIDIVTLNKFKQIGTDYIMVYPCTKQKILQKVFSFVTQDRGN